MSDDIIRVTDDFAIARYDPGAAAIDRFAAEGFRTVANLETEREDQAIGPDAEAGKAREAGLTYVHIPVSGDGLSDDLVDEFRAAVVKSPKPVVAHCKSGKRSGAFVMMHLGVQQGMSGAEVVERAAQMGFECDSAQLEEFVKGYVDARRC
jgi:uncharacterized protein (TIGR01244 family)